MLTSVLRAATFGAALALGVAGSVNAESPAPPASDANGGSSLPSTSWASNPGTPGPPGRTVPEAACFLGLGGSFSSVRFTHQNLFFVGVSDVFNAQTGLLTGTGTASGSIDPFFDSQFGLAPVVQGGYFRHFANSEWLWGAKFSYNYLGARSSKQNVLVPQAGSFSVVATSSPFTGNEEVALIQTSVEHQMSLIAFLGYSFENFFIYLGGGPTLSETTSTLNGVVGFADILGMPHLSITGTTSPENFHNSQWIAGGEAVVGVCYFFTPSWFLDVSYAFGMTARQAAHFEAAFANAVGVFTTQGTNSGTYTGSAITQSLTISINRAF